MSVRAAGCAFVLLAVGSFACPALAATPAANARFAAQLASYMKPTFKKEAPGLVLGKVTCVLPANGTVVPCKAHFTDAKAKANVVYGIKVTLERKGFLRWTTTTHICTDTKTGKKIPC